MLTDVTTPIAFIYGILSFFSPCVLPLIPSYFCFITGMSLDQLTAASHSAIRRKVIVATLAFVLGFSVVFIALGASASLLGNIMAAHKNWIRWIGGALIIIFGLHLSGLVRIPFFEFDKRLQINQKPLHFLGTHARRHGLRCRLDTVYRPDFRVPAGSGPGQGNRGAGHRHAGGVLVWPGLAVYLFIDRHQLFAGVCPQNRHLYCAMSTR
jgi:hypothetical protein